MSKKSKVEQEIEEVFYEMSAESCDCPPCNCEDCECVKSCECTSECVCDCCYQEEYDYLYDKIESIVDKAYDELLIEKVKIRMSESKTINDDLDRIADIIVSDFEDKVDDQPEK